jgi:signal transduction histidine kinase
LQDRARLGRTPRSHRQDDADVRRPGPAVESGRQLLALLLAAIIPVLLFGGWVAYMLADSQRAEARRAAFETVRHVAERVSSEMAAQLQVAETLAASSSLDEPALGMFYDEAERIKDVRPLWETIELADPSGVQVVNLLRPFGTPLGLTADRESFDEVIRTKRPAIGGVGPKGTISGKRLVALRVPVIRRGELRYILTVSFVPNAISSILRDAGAPVGWVGAVVDSRGNIIARTVSEETELWHPASVDLRQAIARAPEGYYMARTLEGLQVETFYRTLPDTGGWSVHFGVPSDVLNAPVSRSIYLLAAGGVASLMLALVLASWMARDIAQRRLDLEERSSLALALSEDRGAMAIQAAELGTWRWDTAERQVSGSERCWSLLDLSDVAGANRSIPSERFLEAVFVKDREAFVSAIDRCVNEGLTIDAEFRSIWQDGSLHWVRVTGRVPSVTRDGHPVVHGVMADIDPHKRAEAERMHLLRRLSEAQENEQRRIARELHDQVGQTVTGLSLGLKGLERRLAAAGSDSAVQEQVEWLQKLTSELGRDIHRAAADLRPTALDDLGLQEALLATASDWAERFGIAVDIQFIGDDKRLPPEIETVVYRVVQEALTNILKHARARNVSIVLERRAQRLRVIVEDDGVGFDPDNPADIPEAEDRRTRPPLGLSGARERLSLVNGSLSIESGPGEGAALFIVIPLPSGDEARL